MEQEMSQVRVSSQVEPPLPPEAPVKKKSSFLPVLLIFFAFILLLGGGGYFAWQKYGYLVKPRVPVPQVDNELPLPSPESPEITPKSQSVIPQPVVADKSDALMIQEALALKHSKQTAEVKLGISKKTEEFASGSVSFTGEIGGGWWLAALSQGSWVIVADGNGNVMCSDIKDYNFPVNMVPECYDSVTGQVVTR